MVALACFGTNVGRVRAAAEAAARSGRRVAVAGRSLLRSVEIARARGYLDGLPPFIYPRGGRRGSEAFDPCGTLLVCTGTQGEERAALASLARGDGRFPRMGRGDTVIMSSRVIPGNEQEVEAVTSALRARGVEVITWKDAPVHASGHPYRGELREFYSIARPRFAVPVHGTHEQMRAHASLALECGAEAAEVLSEGDALAVSRRGLQRIGRVDAPLVASPEGEPASPVPYRPRPAAAAHSDEGGPAAPGMAAA
jgi:ribonuclease J